MDSVFSFFKRRFFNYGLALAAIVAIVLGILGWQEVYDAQFPQTPDPDFPISKASYTAFHTLSAFLFGDAYFVPENFNYNLKIIIAGWLGAFVAASALLKGALRLFIRPLERYYATARRGHTVVIGDREVAHHAAEQLEDKHHQVTYHGDNSRMALSPVLVVPRPQDLYEPFLRRSIDRAKRVIIAEKTDAETAATALAVSKHTKKSTIFAIVDNPWVATQLRQANQGEFDEALEQDELIAVSETRALARTAILPVPPFVLAERAGQSRIHAVFIGFNALSVALIEEMLCTNITPNMKLPRFTILTPNAERAENAFNARHPYFSEETRRSRLGPVDVEFVETAELELSYSAIEALKDITKIDPITSVYVTKSDQEQPLAMALAIQMAARQHDLFKAPIFVQSRQGNGMPRASIKNCEALGIYAFGRWDDLAMALGLMDEAPDSLAKAYHESYCRDVLDNHGADQAWENLAEPFRVANRHAILHIPARLHTLGFDIEPYLLSENALSPSTAPVIAPGEIIVRNGEVREEMAELEHERWMMERWVTGWRCGPRDNQSLRHPNLVAYEDLNEPTKDYDRRFVDWLSTWLEVDKKTGIQRKV